MTVINLDEVASQTGFADILGISQQAVSKQVKKGTLSQGGTYGDWLHEYYDHLADQAAGRGGEGQMDVARATIEEKQTKTALNRLQYHEKLGRLVDIEEARSLLSDWASFTNRQLRQAFERFSLEVESQLDVEVPPELREKYAGAAIERIRGYVQKLGGHGDDGSGDVPGPEELPDQGVSGD